jgi:hypothetical protein
VDKILALRGGVELVAHWAQLASAIEVVTGVVASGVATGLAVLVAQAAPERQRALLGTGLLLTLAVALPVAGAVALLYSALAAAAGWIAAIPTLVNGYWLGRQQRGAMLALAVFSAAAACGAALIAPQEFILEWLAWSQALPAAVILFAGRFSLEKSNALTRFLFPGLVIGILSPLSLLAARAAVADALSWHDAGVLQALWRVSDWICGVAGGVLSFYYLPRFAAARRRAELALEMRHAAHATLWGAAVAFSLAALFQRELLAWLYDTEVQTSLAAAALVFAGSLVRIGAWISLLALYAQHHTRAIVLGEFLSLPLFAALLFACRAGLTLELAGALWLFSFVAYAAFNLWAVLRRTPG